MKLKKSNHFISGFFQTSMAGFDYVLGRWPLIEAVYETQIFENLINDHLADFLDITAFQLY